MMSTNYLTVIFPWHLYIHFKDFNAITIELCGGEHPFWCRLCSFLLNHRITITLTCVSSTMNIQDVPQKHLHDYNNNIRTWLFLIMGNHYYARYSAYACDGGGTSCITACYAYMHMHYDRISTFALDIEYISASRLVMQFSAQCTEATCQVENEDVVGTAPTGDAPTTPEWSTSLSTTKVRVMLEV